MPDPTPANVHLSGRTAVVTGGASGIGRQIALEFARRGAAVVVADLAHEPREGGTPTDELARKEGAQAVFAECDVTQQEQLVKAVSGADQWGGVDIMVNNAAIFRSEEFLQVEPAEFDQMMAVNVRGTFLGCQVAARRMAAKGGGSIINMSSVAGLQGSAGYASYCTSKGAVRLLTYALAEELGPSGIRVNAIHPGVVETAMTTEDAAIVGTGSGDEYLEQIPAGRFGLPADIAGVAVFLASDLSAYVTGASIVVDGGLSRF